MDIRLYANMHTHSTHSDGGYSPAQLAHAAKNEGYGAVVLTDHDTVTGYDELRAECEKLGLETIFGAKFSALILAVFIGLFAYTSIMGWAMYGSRCAEYVLGQNSIKLYQFIFIVLLVTGSILPLSSVWAIADLVNALMSVPNLIALILLSPIVARISNDSFP